jgi:hypothetical protein
VTENDEAIWTKLVQSSREYLAASQAFFQEGVDRVALVRRGLRGDVTETLTALGLVARMGVSEAIQVLDDLVGLTVRIRFATSARQIISSLPREQVLARLEATAEQLLRGIDSVECGLLLELFVALDQRLALKLARLAATDSDPDLREVGETYVKRILVSRPGSE